MNDNSFELKSDKTRSPKNKVRARCPSCSAWVALRDTAEVWDLVSCPECHKQLEIVETRPPTLDYARDDLEDEEWEDEDWDDYEKP